jgi:DNA repair photolyase
MPSCGSQCYLCDLPIRFDTYKGCSHACRYCFANVGRDLTDIQPYEGVKALKSFISGPRNSETKFCDWDIPLHWGGLSDPFQPCEKVHRMSYKALQIFKETQYPFIVSTKGKLVAEKEYLELLKECNCVVQISMVCSKYDRIEKGCPTFEERLEILEKVSKNVKRTIVRVQPYMHEVFKDVYNNLEKFKEAGAHGVIIEGMKFKKTKKGLVKVGGDCTYPYEVIKNDFLQLKKRAHELGLKIYAGENRIRKLGDSLTCCGIDGLDGFIPNKYNLNHMLNGDAQQPTDCMRISGTGTPFRSLVQNTIKGRWYTEHSFEEGMNEYYKTNKKNIHIILGVDKE